MVKSRREHLREYKQQDIQSVFNAVLKSNAISRTNISKETSLSPASVTMIVDELIKQKYLKKTGLTKPTSGRAQRLLSVDSNLGKSITIYIDSSFLFAGKVNIFMESGRHY